MEQQPIMTTKINSLEAAYGVGADGADVIKTGQKRSNTDAGLTDPIAKKTTNTVRFQLEDDDTAVDTKQEQQQQQNRLTQAHTVQESALSVIDTKFDWRNLDTRDKIAAVTKIAEMLSKSGDYLNVNPLSRVYSEMFEQQVDCGYNYQFQMPLQVCTTGLRNSVQYPGQWSALLASTENLELISRLGLPAEVGNAIAFLRNLQMFLNDHLVKNGEDIFLNTAQRLDEENAKILAKNPQAKIANNPYRQNLFVTKGRKEEVYQEMRKIGKYTEEKYCQELQPMIGEFFVAYEDKPPSIQVRAYPKKINGVTNNNIPDVIILNEAGDVETFNPDAPYCKPGHTSWETLLKLSLKWYDGQFRFYLNIRSFRYYLNNNNGANAASNTVIFTDKDGNKRRVVVPN